jgi:hypothetical protein
VESAADGEESQQHTTLPRCDLTPTLFSPWFNTLPLASSPLEQVEDLRISLQNL